MIRTDSERWAGDQMKWAFAASALQSLEYPCRPEWHASQPHTSRIEDRIRHRSEQRLAHGFASSVVRQIGPVGIGIAVHDDDVNLLRRVGVPERRVRNPVDTCRLFGVEPHFFMKRSTQ